MSEKKFMSYGDAESIFTEVGEQLSVRPVTFTGTRDEWDALTSTEKAKYALVNLTDDGETSDVVDAVTDGDFRPVTSNAVYDAMPKIQKGTVATGNASTKKVINVTFPEPFNSTPIVVGNFWTLSANQELISEGSVIILDVTSTGFSAIVKTDQTTSMTCALYWIAVA